MGATPCGHGRGLTRFVRLVLGVVLVAAGITSAAPVFAQPGPSDSQIAVWRVYFEDRAEMDLIASLGLDLVESRGADFLLAVGSDEMADQLRADGFVVAMERRFDQPAVDDPVAELASTEFYGGYRSVSAQYAHLDQVAADHPDLATVYDYGDSWLKQQGHGGHDLKVICITTKRPGDCELDPDSDKARAVFMAAIHSREIQTAELAWRLIDHLVESHGTDADITQILDTTEVWIIPVANPDGHTIVQSGGASPLLHRKNANDTAGECSTTSASVHIGVDLNRNATYGWGETGSSTEPCAQTYRGTHPASESEQESLEALFKQLWPADPVVGDNPVSADKSGIFVSIHSYGEMVLTPSEAPNEHELLVAAFRLAYFNDYAAGDSEQILYKVSGTTDAETYFNMGVPSFTYEVSPDHDLERRECVGFLPAYSCLDDLWDRNRDSLIYAMRVAHDPYVSPLGPTIGQVDIVDGGDGPVLTAHANSEALTTEELLSSWTWYLREIPALADVEYYIDTHPRDGGQALSLEAVDGRLNGYQETMQAEIPTIGMANGEHRVYVRARDKKGFWGPVWTTSFTLDRDLTTGDVTDDGVVDHGDVNAILAHLTGDTPPIFMASPADVDIDGAIALADAWTLAQELE